MAHLMTALALLLAPFNLDLPPEVPIDVAATADATATRGTAVQVTPTLPPPSPALPEFSGASNGSTCTGAVPLLTALSPGWDAGRMARIMFRESRCQPGAVNRSGASGLLQVMRSHCRWLAEQMDTWCTQARLLDPEWNIRAAAVLWREQGYSAWSTS